MAYFKVFSIKKFATEFAAVSFTTLLTFSAPCFSQKNIYPEKNSFIGRFEKYDLPVRGNLTVTCFYQDKKGFIWLGTYQGLFRFDGTEFKQIGRSKINDSTGFAGKLISSISEDSVGNIWFGTSGGLNFYNIKSGSFRNYFPDTSDLTGNNNKILNMLIDSGGKIWLMSLKDIFSFDPRSAAFYRFPLDTIGRKTEEIPYVRNQGQILEDRAGNIWFASQHGLFMHDKSRSTLISFHSINADPTSISSNSISCLAMDQSGNVWISTSDKGLNKVTDQGNGAFKKIRLYLDPSRSKLLDSISVMFSGKDGNIWLFGNRIFGKYQPSTGEFKSYKIPPPVKIAGLNRPDLTGLTFQFAFQSGPDDIIAVAAEPGLLIRFDQKSENASIYTVPNYSVFHAICDREGYLWFSCPFDWVFQLILKPAFSSINLLHDSHRRDYNQQRITQDSRQRIWFTLADGIFVSDPFEKSKYFRLTKYKFPDGYDQAGSVYRDSRDFLWFTRNDGKVAAIDPLKGKMKVYSHSKIYKPGFDIIKEDNRHNIWMTGGGGFYRIDSGSNLIRRFEFPGEEIKKVMSNEGVYDFHFDRNNRLWFGLRSNRIWYYDSKTNIVSSIPVPEDLNLKYGDICFRIKEDPSGNLWMLYVTEGLFMVNPGTRAIRHIEIPWKDGQEGYNDMLIDLSGKIRIIHINGISIYDPVTGKIEDISIKLPDNNCFSFQLDNGDFLLHNNEKLILIDDTIHPNSKPPEVYLTSLRVNNVEYSQLYPGDEEIRSIESVMLKTDQNNLKIEFTGLSFLEAENNQYSYFMKGVDQDTVKTTSGMRFAEYKRLKPGQYQFWVNASNNDGIWNPVGKTLNISITPPGYRSSLAYILYGLGLVLLLYSLIGLRLKRLRREKKRQE